MNLFHSATVVVSAVTKSPPPPPPNLIRGGRLRKTSKGLISFAPFLAGASALALGALLSTTSPVEAGSCSTANQPAGTARCADTADSTDSTESLTASTTGPFTVTDAPNFGLDVTAANSKGIVITSSSTTGLITVDLDGNVKATSDAIEIDQDGTGGVTFEMDGTLTSTGGIGLLVTTLTGVTTGAVTITTTNTIDAESHGIRLVNSGTGAATITASGNIDSNADDGIFVTNNASAGDLTIVSSGTIEAQDQGMQLAQNGMGAVDVTASGNITATRLQGIYVTTGSTATSANIDTTGSTIQAQTTGIQLDFNGTGLAKVTADNVTSNAEDGIRVRGSATQTGNVEVTANGNVTGAVRGIDAYTAGTGEVIVTTAAGTTVTGGHSSNGSNAYALRVHNQGNAGHLANAGGHINVTVDGNLGTSSSRTEGGVYLIQRSFGDSTLTVNGDIFASADSEGARVRNGGVGALNVYINGNVDGGTFGVSVSQVLRTHSSFSADDVIRLTVAGSVEGDVGALVSGLHAVHDSTILVTGTGSITGTDGTALDLDGVADHDVTLQSGATLTGKIDATGATGAVSLDIGGTVAVASGDAIELGGAAAHTVTVGTGGTVTGTIDLSAATGGTTLDISGAISATGGAGGDAIKFDGAGNHTVILRGGADITGRIEKGTAGNVAIRIEGDLTANPIRWSNRSTQASANSLNNFDGGDSIVIADNSRVEFATGTGLNAIPVDLHGRLVFSGISDTQQVQLAVLRGMGGEIEMDINFADGDRERSSARLALNNLHNSAMRIPVNIRAANGFPEFNENLEFIDTTLDTDGDGSITIGQVIQTHGLGNLGEEHFVRGVVLDNGIDDGNWVLELVCIGCDDPLATPTWSVRATPTLDAGTGGGPGGPAVLAGPATLFDTLPAVLAHLGQPESMHARTRNRSFQADTGVWGRIQTGNLSVEPSAASFETGIRNVTFGVHTPLRAERMGFTEPVTLDASITIQTADTEALIMVEDTEETQEIETNALIAGFAATWERDELYVDGQFQYARFDNNLDAADGTKLASPTADSFSAGIEVGLVFEAGDLRLGKWLDRGVLSNILITPSAQVSWSQVGFSDFIASDGRSISLDDGSVANGRLGTVVEALWERVVFHDFLAPASVRLQTNADVIVPLDGKVVTQVDGVNQPSELEDLVLDTGVGVFYTWEREDHTYTISADVSSRQGSEVEDYRGSLGFKYRF